MSSVLADVIARLRSIRDREEAKYREIQAQILGLADRAVPLRHHIAILNEFIISLSAREIPDAVDATLNAALEIDHDDQETDVSPVPDGDRSRSGKT